MGKSIIERAKYTAKAGYPYSFINALIPCGFFPLGGGGAWALWVADDEDVELNRIDVRLKGLLIELRNALK